MIPASQASNVILWRFRDSSSVTTKKLDELCQLQPGWRFGEGSSIAGHVAKRAEVLLRKAEENGWDTDVFPGGAGELLLTCDKGEANLEIVIETSGKLTMIWEKDGIDCKEMRDVRDRAALDYLESHTSWPTSDFYINVIGTLKKRDLLGLPSETPVNRLVTTGKSESPLLMTNAARKKQGVSVTTSNCISKSGQSQQWCGSSPSSEYRDSKQFKRHLAPI